MDRIALALEQTIDDVALSSGASARPQPRSLCTSNGCLQGQKIKRSSDIFPQYFQHGVLPLLLLPGVRTA